MRGSLIVHRTGTGNEVKDLKNALINLIISESIESEITDERRLRINWGIFMFLLNDEIYDDSV